MAERRILRLQQLDNDGHDPNFILLSVQADGSQPLDLKLIGTDNEKVFVKSIKQSGIVRLRSSNIPDEPAAWETILTKTLLGRVPQGSSSDGLEGLEFVASLQGNGLNLIWRRRIGRHIQRLGEATLKETDDLDLANLFDWAGIAADAASSAQAEILALDSKLQEQKMLLAQLDKHLEDLVKAKVEHENALLQKFAELLNSKKQKIRDQQRLLAAAKVDPTAASAIREARHSDVPRDATPSRRNKRKVNGEATAEEAESESDGFEDVQMADDDQAEADREQEEEMAEPETPEKSDLDETEDEDAGDPGAASPTDPSPPSAQYGRRGVAAKGKALEQATASASTVSSESQWSETAKSGQPKSAPRRRELPFSTGKQAKATKEVAKSPPVIDDDETDDEL